MIILVPKDIKDAALKEIYVQTGLETEGHGIAFSVPVHSVVGLSDFQEDAKEDAQ